MRKLVLLLISSSVAILLVAGVALAVTKRCPDTRVNDKCFGTQKDDTLLGNDSFENIYGLGGDDKIEGRGNFDDLFGGAGDDRLLGGFGGDSLYPGAGKDTLFGGPFGDLYVFAGGWERDTIVDGAQDDRNRNEVVIDESVTSGVFMNLMTSPSRSEVRTADGRNTVNWTYKTLVQDVRIDGQGDDLVLGNNAANFIDGGGSGASTGADKVHAMGGGDLVEVDDKDGRDFVDCGEGNDRVRYNPGDTIRNCETREEFEL